MISVKELFNKNKPETVSDYFSLDQLIKEAIERKELEYKNSVDIAVISSSSVNGIDQILRGMCADSDLLANVYLTGYNQFAQDILDSDSDLYKFSPEIIFLNIDFRTIAGDIFFNPYKFNFQERKKWLNETTSFLINFVDKLTIGTNAKIILNNLEVPYYSPLTLLENKQKFGFIESIQKINHSLRDQYKDNKRVFLFDFDSFCGRIGKENILDEKMYYLADIKIKTQYLPSLCNEYSKYIKANSITPKKCIVLDLDDTLWGGIIGEDGIEGIQLGPDTKGKPFIEFQQQILSLYNRGVILAINSKNNYDEAIDVIKNHPYMVLKEKHFAAIRINWDDKVNNLRSISDEINIGLDSMVFFDDDEFNRNLVMQYLPEVEVVDIPEDPSRYIKTLTDLSFFDSLSYTEEDAKKGEMYADEKKRKNLKSKISDLSDYLKILDMRMNISLDDKVNIERISQLTQKTNQFNMTTRRYSEEQIESFINNKNFNIYSLRLSDKYGDYGLTGLAIVEKSDTWRIDNLLLSCRILGREVEQAILAYIAYDAKNCSQQKLIAEFIPTKRNKPARDFYSHMGFKELKNDNEGFWELNLKTAPNYPKYIKIIKPESTSL